MPEQPWRMMNGNRQEPGIECQTVAATKDMARPRTDKLMEEVLRRENLFKALKRVQKNKGAPGVDGMTVDELPAYLKNEWPRIRKELLEATYVPLPTRRKDISKPGGGNRMLGIPTVLERFIGQAILQILTPIFDPHFSEYSYGFRPGRNQRQAVEVAREIVRRGKGYVVDIDLSKFFDRVHHDRLIARLKGYIKDTRILRIIGMTLRSGVMVDGVVEATEEGTTQGSLCKALHKAPYVKKVIMQSNVSKYL